MVRVVDCHAGVLGSNPSGPKDFPFGIALMVSEVFDELMQRNCYQKHSLKKLGLGSECAYSVISR